jgi:hypothetical protein
LIILSTISCLNRQFVDGWADYISTSDTTLNDSSIFVGYVHQIDGFDSFPNDYFKVWIENSDYETTTDTEGFYFIKTIPGTYNIKCQTNSESWDRLTEEMKNVEISKNKKVRIDFFIGYTIE